jgi:predicted DNA-binding transcriptional regulator YafY
LLACQHLLEHVQPGLLGAELGPLRARVAKLLSTQHSTQGELSRRVRLLAMARRRGSGAQFKPVASALTLRRQLRIHYHGRARDAETERTLSPQRLVHYRDNWYLDAWDHGRDALRTFAVDRIRHAELTEAPAREVPDGELDEALGSAYGIFSGRSTAEAVLRFSAHRARWVADEIWHPEQRGAFLDDGRYELCVPFADPRELVMDILKYGPEVEVVAPSDLRLQVRERLLAAIQRYG